MALMNLLPNPGQPDFRKRAREIATETGIDPDLFEKQIETESAFNPRAKSPAGAMGLGQLMPGTANDLGVSDPFDPEQNLKASAKYMRQLNDTFGGDKQKSLAAYNWGMGNVQKKGLASAPPETQNYLKKILGENVQSKPLQPVAVDGTGSENVQSETGADKGEKRKGIFANFFTGKTTPGGVDEYGVKKPDIKEQSTLSKILSYLIPMAYGAANDAGILPGLMVGLAGSAARRQWKNAAEMDRYGADRGAKVLKMKLDADAAKKTGLEKELELYRENPDLLRNMWKDKASSNPFQLLNYDLSEKKFKQDLEERAAEKALKEKGKDLPKDFIEKIAGFRTVGANIKMLRDSLAETNSIGGPIKGALGKLNPFDNKVKILDAKFKAQTKEIAKAIEGGKLTDSDQDFYDKVSPSVLDSPEVRKEKLRQLDERIALKKDIFLDTLNRGKYNLEGFEDLQNKIDKFVAEERAPIAPAVSQQPSALQAQGVAIQPAPTVQQNDAPDTTQTPIKILRDPITEAEIDAIRALEDNPNDEEMIELLKASGMLAK